MKILLLITVIFLTVVGCSKDNSMSKSFYEEPGVNGHDREKSKLSREVRLEKIIAKFKKMPAKDGKKKIDKLSIDIVNSLPENKKQKKKYEESHIRTALNSVFMDSKLSIKQKIEIINRLNSHLDKRKSSKDINKGHNSSGVSDLIDLLEILYGG
tara:strand:+ start:796 stop:1260 length:465 start_codon:yes stop_codon:yes gene_type:complete